MSNISNRAELIAACEKEYQILSALLQQVDAGQAMKICAKGISVKDTIAHLSHWTALFLGRYRQAQSGAAASVRSMEWN